MDASEFTGEASNPFTELCELRIKAERSDTRDSEDIQATLKFDCMLWDHSDIEFRIGLSRAYVHLSLGGYKVKMGTSIAETKPQHVDEVTEASASSGTAVNAQLSANSEKPLPTLTGNVGLENEGTELLKRTRRKTEYPLRSLPNNRWEVMSPHPSKTKEVIKGTVLSNESLCTVTRDVSANSNTISCEVIARKSDIEVEAIKGNSLLRQFRVYKNKEAVIGAIAAKALQREAARNSHSVDEKVVVVARHVLEGR